MLLNGCSSAMVNKTKCETFHIAVEFINGVLPQSSPNARTTDLPLKRIFECIITTVRVKKDT